MVGRRVRLLCSFVGGEGHLQPLLPVARAVRAAGHTVAVAGAPAMASAIEAAGLPAIAVGPDVGGTRRRIPLRPLDAAREDAVLRDGYAGWMARERAAALLPVSARWRPDVVMHDEVDFGSAVAAERLGLPHATVLVMAAGSFVRPTVVAGPLHDLRATHGLPPDPELAMLHRDLVLSPFPPGFRDPASPLPRTAHSYRPWQDPTAPSGPSPPWASRPAVPTVYLTLGTVFNTESGDLFTRVVDGLRELPIQLVVTVGRCIDPTELGPQPAHVHVARYIPQSMVLPHCDLVVSHGGSGTVASALAHGLPLVCIPLGADQTHNAARCHELGLGRILDPVTVTSSAARQAVADVLADPRARQAAERLRAEWAALPGPTHAVAMLERLADLGT